MARVVLVGNLVQLTGGAANFDRNGRRQNPLDHALELRLDEPQVGRTSRGPCGEHSVSF